ncbi:hypothetical protein V8C35DRAFT_307413 [Trichoderma chlorosporum]
MTSKSLSAFPTSPPPYSLYFPHGPRADSRVGPAWGKTGGKSWRCHRRRCLPKGNFRSYSAALFHLFDPLQFWCRRGRGSLSARSNALPAPSSHCRDSLQACAVLVIDRAGGGLAANCASPKSAIWSHLRTLVLLALEHWEQCAAIRGVMRSSSVRALRMLLLPASHRITGASSAVCRIASAGAGTSFW